MNLGFAVGFRVFGVLVFRSGGPKHRFGSVSEWGVGL